MPLRIAFDMDGVLADMNGALARIAQGIVHGGAGAPPPALAEGSRADGVASGPGMPPAEATAPPNQSEADEDLNAGIERIHLTPRQQRMLWKKLDATENFWETLDEIEPGMVKRLGELAAARRWEIIFLTKRPVSAGDTCQTQTQRWLQQHGFPIPSVFVVRGSRGRIASALSLDFVVDDRPENCLDVVLESRARSILVWREPEDALPSQARRLGIGVVTTMQECLDILERVDDLQQKPGMLDRIKRLLGIEKEPLET